MVSAHSMVFDSENLERTEAFLSSAYAPMRIRSPSQRTRTTITRDAADSVSVDRLDLEFELSYDVQPLGKVCLCTVHSGTVESHTVAGWGTQESFGAGETVLFAPADLPFTGKICRSRYTITMFDPLLLDQVAAAVPGRKPKRIRLLGNRAVSVAAGRQLRNAIDYVGEEVLVDPAVRENPLVLSAASWYLAVCVLNAFPNTALATPTATDRRDAHPAALRRAIAFIEAHADSDIGSADIAAAAKVTIRALQYAFRRQLGTTPMAHLRRVRLERARLDLLAADPGETTVAEIASRWGFGHLGRFAATYRAAYGRTPSEELQS